MNVGSINNAYATGAVTGTDGIGGLVGDNNGGSISNSFWDTATTNQPNSAGGTGLTDSQMKQQASFTGWDFANTWQINEGVSYPTLIAPVTQSTTVTTEPPVTQPTFQTLQNSNDYFANAVFISDTGGKLVLSAPPDKKVSQEGYFIRQTPCNDKSVEGEKACPPYENAQ